MQKLKQLNELGEPDVVNTLWVRPDGTKLTIKEYYGWAEQITLHEGVPENVRSQFNVALNVWIYSWYVYAFHQVAEMKAFSVAELALKEKLNNPRLKGFRNHLNEAIDQGFFSKDAFIYSNGRQNRMPEEEYIGTLPDFLCGFRNRHAHEGTSLHPGSLQIIGTCADIINQLFKTPEGRKEKENVT